MKWLLPLLLAGCAVIQVSGYTLSKDRWEYDSGLIKKRAAFEIHCPDAQLELVVLAVYSGTIVAQQVGVTGCGHKLVYVASTNDGWLLNSSDGVAK